MKQLQWLFDAGKNPPDFATNMKEAIKNLDNTAIDNATLTKFGVPNGDALKAKILNNFDAIFKLKYFL